MSSVRSHEWTRLEKHRDVLVGTHLRDLFDEDRERGTTFVAEHDGLYFDYSKQRVTRETIDLLVDLARSTDLQRGIDAMFSGEIVNVTERRPALHTALRAPRGSSIRVAGEDVVPHVHGELERMRLFAARVRDGRWRGFTGRRARTVVNIGIGGSDLGPAMACHALSDFADGDLTSRFVSNVDGSEITSALKDLDPAETIFIVSSKTFTTVETLTNARTARRWLIDGLGYSAAVAQHFVAVSTDHTEVRAFGIEKENVFGFWDWVGGRYSLPSAIGMSLMVAIGPDGFDELLAGAHAMDRHFHTAPAAENLPILLGLLGIWNRNFLDASTHAVLPYDARLAMFPAYLQQLEMESNGKSITNDGSAVTIDTAPVVWGSPGTNGQHAYFQLLHQGTTTVPADFIGVVQPAHCHNEHHDLLVANLFAQTQALAFGRPPLDDSSPHRTFDGNRQTSTLLVHRLTPYSLGQLVALYEHKVFTQGWIWGIDSFDQWGVELGKVLAGEIMIDLQTPDRTDVHDSSTNALIARYKTSKLGQPDHATSATV